MHDDDVRAAPMRDGSAADADDFAAARAISADDAVLEYPRSDERIRGRERIPASRSAQPDKNRVTVRRVPGGGSLRASELVMTYGERPFHVVGLTQFAGDRVVRETPVVAEPFEPGPSRAQSVERRA